MATGSPVSPFKLLDVCRSNSQFSRTIELLHVYSIEHVPNKNISTCNSPRSRGKICGNVILVKSKVMGPCSCNSIFIVIRPRHSHPKFMLLQGRGWEHPFVLPDYYI